MESEKRSSVSQYLHSLFSTKSGLLLVVCIILFVCALFVLLLNMVRRDDGKAVLVNDVKSEQTGMRELSGTVLMLGEGNAFIRLSIVGEGVYSVGLNADTRISQDGVAFDVAALRPFSKVAVTALKLPSTEKFDFLARSITLPKMAQQTPEERSAELFDTAATMRAN